MVEVSIIIPAYNQDKYLEETLKSVIAQSFKDFECIIIDDGSIDDTAGISKKFSEHKSIKYHYQNNKGLAGARNTGIILAKGKYVHFLDSDDLIEVDFLDRMIEKISGDQSIDILICGWMYIDKDSKKISGKIGPVRSDDYFEDLSLGNLFPVHSAIVRRTLFEKIGLFDESLKALEDWDLWLRAAGNGSRFDILDMAGVYYRRQPGSMTMNAGIMIDNLEKFLDSATENIEGFKDQRDYTRIYQLLKILIYTEEAGDIKSFQMILKNVSALFTNIKYDHTFFNKMYEIIRNLKDIKAKRNLIETIYQSSPNKYRLFWKNKVMIMNIKKIIKKV